VECRTPTPEPVNLPYDPSARKFLSGFIHLFEQNPGRGFTLRELMQENGIFETRQNATSDQAYNRFSARMAYLLEQAKANDWQLPFEKYHLGVYAHYRLPQPR
jgi:hypothetical protein